MFERLKRFFIEKELTDELEIDEDLYHQLKNVLRMKIGDQFVFMNDKEVGEYQFYFGMKKSGIFNLTRKQPHDRVDYSLNVFLSILQRDYLDFVLEKLGEIGVTSVTPVITKRSIQQTSTNTIDRMKKLIYKGILQAEHNFLPKVEEPVELKDIVADTKNNFVLYERIDNKSKAEITSKDVSILIGPEGGFEASELIIMEEKGFNVISPIKGVLKAETAAIIFAGYFKIFIDTFQNG